MLKKSTDLVRLSEKRKKPSKIGLWTVDQSPQLSNLFIEDFLRIAEASKEILLPESETEIL